MKGTARRDVAALHKAPSRYLASWSRGEGEEQLRHTRPCSREKHEEEGREEE